MRSIFTEVSDVLVQATKQNMFDSIFFFFLQEALFKNIVRGKLDAPYALLTVVIENNLVTNMKIIAIKKYYTIRI